jgi:phospholipase/carboxylesterase
MLESAFIASAIKSDRLLIALHGLGDSMEGYRFLPQYLKIPWLNCLLVNAPDPYYEGFSWYDLYGDAGLGVRRSRELLFRLLDSKIAEGFPASGITIFGFSQGCLMTMEIGMRYPQKLAGLIGVSGYVHEPEKAIAELSAVAKDQRFLVTHGTEDPLIPIHDVRDQIKFLQRMGLNIEWQEFRKEHTIAGSEEIDRIRAFLLKGYPTE